MTDTVLGFSPKAEGRRNGGTLRAVGTLPTQLPLEWSRYGNQLFLFTNIESACGLCRRECCFVAAPKRVPGIQSHLLSRGSICRYFGERRPS